MPIQDSENSFYTFWVMKKECKILYKKLTIFTTRCEKKLTISHSFKAQHSFLFTNVVNFVSNAPFPCMFH